MESPRLARAFAVAALALGTALACAPERTPLAPGQRRADLLESAVETLDTATSALGVAKVGTWSLPALRRNAPLRENITVTATIGARGGRLEIPAAGFALDVPAGAVLVPTAFTVTALAGDLLAYEFGPDGSVFPVALQASQDLRVTQTNRLPKRASLRAGYFRSQSDVNQSAATASVSQESRTTVSATGHRLTFGIPHFSGWIVLWRDGSGGDSTETP
ncbi:hypothetical protein [Roseisolibacter sp. H3M3-2]|uniref:hypothetical protein n=1 Tax=Roseisolibacter sp. H3M3-2 TaxID=3031323 RepID=UPI0023DADED3|nr:hypothetical protein [Roseisolibacter sp. H3M3-2]MDF1506155.1 hypothetical protein [Roseisolibacter sp. H3M3-2]